MSYPFNLVTRQVTGKYADFYESPTGDIDVRPKEGFVYITPYYKEIKILESGVVVDLYELENQKIKVGPDGRFHAELLVTNQAGISPSGDESGNGWTYKFTSSWNDYEANIPIDAGTTELDINDWFAFPERPGIIVTKGDKGDDGRGIVNVTANGVTATVHYTDNTTSQFTLPGGSEGSYQYIHEQNTAEADWVINHNLGRYITSCFVTYGSSDEQVFATWTNTSLNTIVVHHGAACSGKAVI